MTNLVQDLSTLTTIPKKNLNRLIDVAIYSINETIAEDLLQGNDVSEVNIGLGNLYIQCSGNKLNFKFIPSAKLREEVINTIKNKENSLELTLEKNLIDRITNTYKDII